MKNYLTYEEKQKTKDAFIYFYLPGFVARIFPFGYFAVITTDFYTSVPSPFFHSCLNGDSLCFKTLCKYTT